MQRLCLKEWYCDMALIPNSLFYRMLKFTVYSASIGLLLSFSVPRSISGGGAVLFSSIVPWLRLGDAWKDGSPTPQSQARWERTRGPPWLACEPLASDAPRGYQISLHIEITWEGFLKVPMPRLTQEQLKSNYRDRAWASVSCDSWPGTADIQ